MNFEEVCRQIKEIRIQGATNVAKAATKALLLKSDAASVKKLLSLRPTEPTMRNSVAFALSFKDLNEGVSASLNYFDASDKIIAELGASKIKNNSNIFVHCHSTTLMNIFREAKRQGKKFTVHSTETRPLYQGRITAKDLSEAGINIVHYVDAAARIAMKKCDIAFFGADAITPKKIYNKVGSEMFAIIAKEQKIPVYICSDAWKFSKTEEIVEQRSPDEVWHNPPKGTTIENPSFEKIDPTLVQAIISELGVLSHKEFLKKVKEIYPFIK
jgi:ribose 1,5-bisphosphate isomerase